MNTEESDNENTKAVAPPSAVVDIANSVRARRRALGLRQEELADLAGVSIRFIHSVEHEKSSTRLDKLLDVFEVLGLALHVVTPGQNDNQLPAPK